MGYTRTGVTDPIPDSATVCGELVALSLTDSVAVSADGTLGSKSTRMAQLLCGARLAPQLLACWKSPLSMEMLEIASATSPPFVSVTFCGLLLFPIW